MRKGTQMLIVAQSTYQKRRENAALNEAKR